MEKSCELTTIYGEKGHERDIPRHWTARRSNFMVYLIALAAMSAVTWIALGVPGHETLSHALDLVLALISN